MQRGCQWSASEDEERSSDCLAGCCKTGPELTPSVLRLRKPTVVFGEPYLKVVSAHFQVQDAVFVDRLLRVALSPGSAHSTVAPGWLARRPLPAREFR